MVVLLMVHFASNLHLLYCPLLSHLVESRRFFPVESFFNTSQSFNNNQLLYCLLSNMVARSSLLSIFATFVAVTVGQKCYGLDGTALDDSYAPCNTNAKHSGCCATKRTTGSPDICLDNGLCLATNNELMGTIWQSGCTDATGRDTACPRMCPDGMSNSMLLHATACLQSHSDQ
jgi:hypothetical protein